jgi:mannosyltransferase OCH1-like enzyme
VHIPKILHITWPSSEVLTSTHIFPSYCIQNLIKLSSDWRVELSTDEDLDFYLKSTLDTLDYILIKDKHIVTKSDLWRLLKLYLEGGAYCDIDRLCNKSLNDIITSDIKCLLPTCGDYNFSQDFMSSAPGNPIYAITAELMLQRIRNGSNNTYFLGPQTYMHGVTKGLLGEIIDVNPGPVIFSEIRQFIAKMSFVYTYKENVPYDTILCSDFTRSFDHETLKRDFYKEQSIKHWTGDW